jgi:hypothetical protein
LTTYTFNPTTTTQSVQWSDPSVWAGGVFPNSIDADVIFPIILYNGSPFNYSVTIANNELYTVRSVDVTNTNLTVDGSLNISQALTLHSNYLTVVGSLAISQALVLNPQSELDMQGGVLSANSLQNDGIDIQGYGQVNTTGTLTKSLSEDFRPDCRVF